MSVKITDINIACDAALDQDVNQEIGFLGERENDILYSLSKEEDKMDSLAVGEQEKLDFFSYEEERDRLEREFFGVCECCNGTGHYWDCDPGRSKKVPCDNCNGAGFINDKEESKPHCPNCKDTKLVESSVPMVGDEECYYCKDINE